jgi:hypothetical protein
MSRSSSPTDRPIASSTMNNFTVKTVNAHNNYSFTKEYEISAADFYAAKGSLQNQVVILDEDIHGLTLSLHWGYFSYGSYISLQDTRISVSRSAMGVRTQDKRFRAADLVASVTVNARSDHGEGSWVHLLDPSHTNEVQLFYSHQMSIQHGECLRIKLKLISEYIATGPKTAILKGHEIIAANIDSSTWNDLCFVLYRRIPFYSLERSAIGLVYANKAALAKVSPYFESCMPFRYCAQLGSLC